MQKIKSSLIIILPILAILVLFWLGGKAKPTETAQLGSNSQSATLIASEPKFNFGSVSMAAGKVNHLFAFKNTTAEPIQITRVYTSCMCTTALLKINGTEEGPFGMPGHMPVPSIDKTLAPGEEASIEAIFDPAAHGPSGLGHIERSILVENAGGLVAKFDFAADVTP